MMRILAIDLGTSSVKFMRIDERARVLSVDRTPIAGLSVESWIDALGHNLARHGDQRDIGGIAVTGQMHGLMTREDGSTWGEGIPWNDNRSADDIPAILEAIGQDAAVVTGGVLAPGFLAASLVWVREHDPARWGRITSVHLPKDGLIHELTGEHVTDPTDAAGTGLYASGVGDWAWQVVDALDIPHGWLPRLMPSGSIAGGLRAEYAALLGLPRGLPIILGGGDAPAGAYGANVMRDSEALVMLSTGAQVILPSRSWSPDPEGRWYTWPSVATETSGFARFLKVGTLLNAGNVTRWAEKVLVDDEISVRPSGLIALPHFIGTREYTNQRGALFGLDENTTPGQIRTALMEGLAFSARTKLQEMMGSSDAPACVRLGGGLAHREDVRQLFADVLSAPVETVVQPEATAYGTGLLALQNLTGLVADAVLAPGELTVPDANRSYDAAYALYRDLERALVPYTTRIAVQGNER
jgi:xylulokinase